MFSTQWGDPTDWWVQGRDILNSMGGTLQATSHSSLDCRSQEHGEASWPDTRGRADEKAVVASTINQILKNGNNFITDYAMHLKLLFRQGMGRLRASWRRAVEEECKLLGKSWGKFVAYYKEPLAITHWHG